VKEALTSYFEIEVRRTLIPKNSIAGVTTYSTMAFISVTYKPMIAQMAWIMCEFQCYSPSSGDSFVCNGVVVNWPRLDPRYRIKRDLNLHSG
jgi:xanthine/uracil/vitamin C permease (AzgA family)